jgi:hypothetical protein
MEISQKRMNQLIDIIRAASVDSHPIWQMGGTRYQGPSSRPFQATISDNGDWVVLSTWRGVRRYDRMPTRSCSHEDADHTPTHCSGLSSGPGRDCLRANTTRAGLLV